MLLGLSELWSFWSDGLYIFLKHIEGVYIWSFLLFLFHLAVF